jgi:hypothetical protein
MRRLALASLVVLAAACGDSPCQDLGERICSCQPGMSEDACTSQVEAQLEDASISDGTCEQILDACTAPAGADFCEWLLTEDGKDACRLTPPPPAG